MREGQTGRQSNQFGDVIAFDSPTTPTVIGGRGTFLLTGTLRQGVSDCSESSVPRGGDPSLSAAFYPRMDRRQPVRPLKNVRGGR
jgi:hypothetical protein